MKKGLYAAVIAGQVSLLGIANAADSTVGLGPGRYSQSQQEAWAALPLPAVPHINTMPWLTSGLLLRGPKIDILIGPRPETIGPFLVRPSGPPLQTFSDAGRHVVTEQTE